MKKFCVLAAVVLCCAGCVAVNAELGKSIIPDYLKYTSHFVSFDLDRIEARMTDSLSGFSQTRMCVGAVKDEEFGLSTRSCVLTLVPLTSDPIDFGDDPVCTKFHVSSVLDTISVIKPDQQEILQSLYVTEMLENVSSKTFDCNMKLKHGTEKITLGTPVLTGIDSMSFDLKPAYGQKYIDALKADTTLYHDFTKYTKALPGMYLETDKPSVDGNGRINIYSLQLEFNSSTYNITGNYAELSFRTSFGERKDVDTSVLFYFCPTDMYDVDSLFSKGTSGSYPQYCLNLTGHEAKYGPRRDVSEAETFRIEGGGGYKPVISAAAMREYMMKALKDTLNAYGLSEADTSRAVIIKASVVLPFVFPEDYRDATKFPPRLSPTCRIHSSDTTISYMGLSDSSNSEENQGDINRSTCIYSPDISYHLQKLLEMSPSEVKDEYDLWMLFMANETTLQTTSGDDEMSEYYQYLAYQNYYNSVYGGYGSSYGTDSYTNYYTYMMMAEYAGGQTYTSSDMKLDLFRYYNAELCGPANKDAKRRPKFKITFAIPKK